MKSADGLTFFAWTDTHFGYEPRFAEKDHRWSTMQQMIHLPGWPYPPEIGGAVDSPAFIMNCGDFVDGSGRGEEELLYYLHCIRQIDIRHLETLGNHDIISPSVVDWFIQKYGGKYYSFDQKGIHFVVLYLHYGEGYTRLEALDEAQLEWLERDLSNRKPAEPVVIFSHDRLERLPNSDDVDSLLRRANVILMLSGHKHNEVGAYTWNGRNGFVIGHCRDHPADSIFGRRSVVVKITEKEVKVVPWRWDLQEWARRQMGPTPEVGRGRGRTSRY